MSRHVAAWAMMAARRAAAARGMQGAPFERFVAMIAPKIAAVGRAICEIETRRGPREIALAMLRNIAGRHSDEIAPLLLNCDEIEAARTLLLWSTEGVALASDNKRPDRSLRPDMRLVVFHADGRRTEWERVVRRASDGPARGAR